MLPSVVSKTSMEMIPSGRGPLGFGDALVAGEIAVRGYVSEATRDKRRAHCRTLRRAMFERDPPTRLQMVGPTINKSVKGGQAIPSGCERQAGLAAHTIRLQRRILSRDVGRIADD